MAKNDIFNKYEIDVFDLKQIKSLIKYRPNWQEYFMLIAKIAASRSTCLSRPAGAVIVKDKQILATGYNGSMPGVAHCTDEGVCYRRASGASDAGKYDNCRSIHAEANAIAQAAKHGINIKGAEMYMTLFPCYVCTKLMVSAGITKVYFEYEYQSVDSGRDKHWKEALIESGINFEKVTLNEETIKKLILSIISETSVRHELNQKGEPTGKIENINSDKIVK